MSLFKDAAQAQELFGELWNKMVHDTEFGAKLREAGITIRFVVNNPDLIMFVDENGPLFGEEAEARDAVVTMKMSLDSAHRFWLKKLNIPKALALGQVKAKGPMGTVLKLLPLLRSGQDLYPSYCEKYNLPTQ